MAPQPRLPVPHGLWGCWTQRQGLQPGGGTPHPFTGPMQPGAGRGSGRLEGGHTAWEQHSLVLPVKTSHSTSLSRATSFSFLQNFLCSGQLARWHATPQ